MLLALFPCAAAVRGAADGSIGSATLVFLATCLAALASGVAADGDSSRAPLGGALVVAAMSLIAFGFAAVLTRCRVSSSRAAFCGAALALLPTALLFVADPWIEWGGPSLVSPERAQAVLTVNPVAALCSGTGGAGVDWLRLPILYDGPATGVSGLSVIGQYYQGATPTPSLVFGACAAGIGFLLAFLGGWRATITR